LQDKLEAWSLADALHALRIAAHNETKDLSGGEVVLGIE
jgi:hypothetical protein